MKLMEPVVLAACSHGDAGYVVAAGGKQDRAASTAVWLLECCKHLHKLPLAHCAFPSCTVLSSPGAVC